MQRLCPCYLPAWPGFTTVPSRHSTHSTAVYCLGVFARYNKHDNAYHMNTQVIREETQECKDLKSQCTLNIKMYLAFNLNYLEIQFATACFICVHLIFPKMRRRTLSPKATVDAVNQENILPKSN